MFKYHKLSALKKLEGNPRIIRNEQFKTLCESIRNNPKYFEARPLILSDRTGELVIIAGNQRYEAAKAERLTEAPTFLMEGLTEEKEREIIIRDNISNGEFDFDALANAWSDLPLSEWGVDLPEDWLTQEPSVGLTDDDAVPDDVEPISKTGDLWLLGENRVLCGDATKREDVERLMDGEKADMVWTDPPFEMENTDFMQLLLNSCNGAILIMHSDKNMVNLVSKYINQFHYFLVHYYSFGFARSSTAPQMAHHLIGVFGNVKFINQKDGFKTVIPEQMERDKLMPYQKKVEIMAACIEHFCNGKTVLDGFGGSGSTLIACEKLYLFCRMLEIDPKYCDVIVKRWENYTGGKAKLL